MPSSTTPKRGFEASISEAVSDKSTCRLHFVSGQPLLLQLLFALSGERR